MIKQQGFTLFELMISMLLTTILMTAAFAIYNQVQKSSQLIEHMTNYDTKVAIFQDRLATDLAGITPLWFSADDYEKIKARSISPDKQSTKKKFNDQVTENKFFYAEVDQNKRFNFFTFATVNAMQMYGSNNQRFVRVVYKLVPKPGKENIFKLMRKEEESFSAEFESASIIKSGTFYTILDNLKLCNFEYGFIDQPKNNQNKKQQPDKPSGFKWLTDWGVVIEKTKTNEYKPALPEFIKVTIKFVDPFEKSHEYICHITNPVNPINLVSFAQEHHNKAIEKLKSKKDESSNKPQDDKGAPRA